MNASVLDGLVYWAAIVWLAFKWYKSRQLKFLLFATILAFFSLSRWPLILPTIYSLSGMGLCGAAFLFYELRVTKRKPLEAGYIYVILLVTLSLACAAVSWLK